MGMEPLKDFNGNGDVGSASIELSDALCLAVTQPHAIIQFRSKNSPCNTSSAAAKLAALSCLSYTYVIVDKADVLMSSCIFIHNWSFCYLVFISPDIIHRAAFNRA